MKPIQICLSLSRFLTEGLRSSQSKIVFFTKNVALILISASIVAHHAVAQLSSPQESQSVSTSNAKLKRQSISIKRFYTYNIAEKKRKAFLSIPAIRKSIGKRMLVRDLKKLSEAIDRYSRRKGWKYRAHVLPLNYAKGIVAIDVRHESDWKPTPKTDAQGNKLITVRYIFSYGQARFDKKAIKAIPEIRRSRGQTMTVQKLAELAKPINDYYRQRNLDYVARVEPKDFTNGIVAITVIPQLQSDRASADDPPIKEVASFKEMLPKVQPPKKIEPTKILKLRRVNIKVSDTLLQEAPTQFQEDIQNEIGKPINAERYKRISDIVVKYYRKQGYFIANVQVKSNPQRADELDIYTFAGEIEKVVVDNQSHYRLEQIKDTATQNICQKTASDCAGTILMKDNTERAVGIIGDLPGLTGTKISLRPGKRQGTTVANILVKDAKRYRGYFSIDNKGGSITGKNRATVGFIGHSLAGIGDQAVFELTTTDKSDNTIGQLGYSIPVLYDGWRVGLNFSRSQYYLYEEFKDARIKGKSDNYSLWATYPIIRTKRHNLSTRLSYDSSHPEDSILGITQPQRRIDGLSVSLNGQVIDSLLLKGRSFSNYGLTLQQNSIEANAAYRGSTGSFTRLLWNASRDQSLLKTSSGDRLSLYLSLRGQEANKTMDASMRYSLGGPSGVRAYPGGEAPGDRGALGTLELRYGIYLQPVLPGFLTLALFHDRGWKKNAEIGIGHYGYGSKTIYGNGISVNLSVLDQWSIKAEWAKRATGSARALTEDDPSDSRFWLTGSVNF